jgi:hypothetical protein
MQTHLVDDMPGGNDRLKCFLSDEVYGDEPSAVCRERAAPLKANKHDALPDSVIYPQGALQPLPSINAEEGLETRVGFE